MFRHQGKARTHQHNLRIASLLSYVAGLVNVAGFLSVQRLTTNVTGHFAFVTDEVFKMNFKDAFIFLLYILSFLAGSFVSNFVVEVISRKSERFIFTIPVLTESAILFVIALAGDSITLTHPGVIACSLLFAMGLQNSLVTQISSSVVRTTHLTGLFTDLGIELSQLLFYKEREQKKKLLSSIQLRLTIISFFFAGGIIGGLFYSVLNLHVLILAVAVLLGGLAYDNLKFRFIRLKRKLPGRDTIQ